MYKSLNRQNEKTRRDRKDRIPGRLFLLFFSFILPLTGLLFQYNLGRADLLPLPRWNSSTPLSEVLASLGDSAALERHNTMPKGIDSLLIRRGYDIIRQGFTVTAQGDTSGRVSRYFVCTDCHNTLIEDPELGRSNPETRLRFATEQDIPFLPGTTLKGVTDRERWYNGDYMEKYGARAIEAHDDLRKAVQLCADECSKGRPLEEWELNAVLAYLQSISFTLGELNLSDSTWSRLLNVKNGSAAQVALIAELKSYYLQASPATFLPAPEDPTQGYRLPGDPARGREIYHRSCLHCHKPGGVTRFELENDTISLKRLKAKIRRTNESGFYQAIRHGVASKADRPQYMPRYTAERMSDQQIEDLRAYVEEMK